MLDIKHSLKVVLQPIESSSHPFSLGGITFSVSLGCGSREETGGKTEWRTSMKRIQILVGTLVVALTAVLPLKAQNQLTNGLVAYYPFNGDANDASGNGN